jgi:hypothetical protein
VVKTVRVAVPAALLVIFTGLLESKLKTGGFRVLLLGVDVMAAVRTMPPVKPDAGVTVIVEVFPVVAPGATVIGVPVIVNGGAFATVTVTELEATA